MDNLDGRYRILDASSKIVHKSLTGISEGSFKAYDGSSLKGLPGSTYHNSIRVSLLIYEAGLPRVTDIIPVRGPFQVTHRVICFITIDVIDLSKIVRIRDKSLSN